jgi:uncharacterized OsmC-like protein
VVTAAEKKTLDEKVKDLEVQLKKERTDNESSQFVSRDMTLWLTSENEKQADIIGNLLSELMDFQKILGQLSPSKLKKMAKWVTEKG